MTLEATSSRSSRLHTTSTWSYDQRLLLSLR
jgi:hypothetical protein